MSGGPPIETAFAEAPGRPLSGGDYVIHLPGGLERHGEVGYRGVVWERSVPPVPSGIKFEAAS